MTVNELITKLDLLPADAEILVCQDDGDFLDVTEVRLSDNGTVIFEVA